MVHLMPTLQKAEVLHAWHANFLTNVCFVTSHTHVTQTNLHLKLIYSILVSINHNTSFFNTGVY